MPPVDAVTVVVPRASAVIVPVETNCAEPALAKAATVGSDELHVTELVRSWVVLLL